MIVDIKDDDFARKIAQRFGYRGKTATYRKFPESGMTLDVSWQGGFRHNYWCVDVKTSRVLDVRENVDPGHPMYGGQRTEMRELPEGAVLIDIPNSRINQLIIYYNPANAPQQLPEPVELSENERYVLNIIGGYKSSFRKEQVRWDKKVTLDEYEELKIILQEKGLLNKRGAITTKGRNAR